MSMSVILLDNNEIGLPEQQDNERIVCALYYGVKGYRGLQRNSIQNAHQRIYELEKLARNTELVVISEVQKEAENYLRILNQQIDYLSAKINPRGRRFKIKWGLLQDEDTENLTSLQELAKSYAHFQREIRDKDPREKWVNGALDQYMRILSFVENISPDLDRISSIRKAHLNTHNPVGEELGTDHHLIATAYMFARQKMFSPVILSSDKGLSILAQRVNENAKSLSFARYNNIPQLPLNAPIIVTPFDDFYKPKRADN